MGTSYAFVTLVSSDSYLPGALTVASALKDVHPTPVVPPEVPFQTVCLVTPETVDVTTIKLLRRAFDVVIGVEVITQEDKSGLILLGRPDLNTVLTKLHVFRLTQFSRIIFLDADILPIRPLSHLFTLPCEFSASPDVGWPDIFNSGLMVLSPGEDKFNELTELLKSNGSWDGGDQGILNEWRGGNWNRLSFSYNTTPTAAYTYAPAYERFGSQISAIHFIGPKKPWSALSYRSPFSSQSIPPSDSHQQAYDYNSLVDRWYAVYDRHYRSQAISGQQSFEIKRYESAWNEPSGSGKVSAASISAENTLSLEELRLMAIEGMSAASRTPYDDKPSDDKSPEGQYQSMPLEGRVDLMRPIMKLQMAEEAPTTETEAAKVKKRPEILDISKEEGPSTPVARRLGLPGDLSPRWRTLPTPGPNEIPPSPHPHPIPLPPVTPSMKDDLRPPQVPSEPESPSHRPSKVQPQELQPPELQPPELQPQELQRHELQLNLPPSQELQLQKLQRYELQLNLPPSQIQPAQAEHPLRCHSPPMLLWNPAVEPPPTETPLSSAFPSSTYFPNVWDSSPPKPNQQPHTPLPSSGALFEPLPRTEIPESLIRQGHYRNVTGEDQHGATPSPDQTKIKHVFPWEEKPRHLPGRVFPAADSPKPALFLSPESQTSQTSSSEVPTTPETKSARPAHVLSPLYGLPSSLTYPNAWDSIPSIQKYASKLARPSTPRTLAPAFDEGVWDKKVSSTWEEKAEASSRDGDVEDEGEESADERVAGKFFEDDNVPVSAKALQRSRRGSSVSVTRTTGETRTRYRDFGVQTITRVMRAQGVQTVTLPLKPQNGNSAEPDKKPILSGRRHWAPSSRPNVSPAVTVHDSGNGRSMSAGLAPPSPAPGSPRSSPRTSPPSPAHLRSPFPASPSLPAPGLSKIISPPLRSSVSMGPQSPAIPSPSVVTRQPSNDSSLGSPASSIGPVSPSDGHPITSPLRKGGRVWDPARGVELFKRGSEEVLARFLKMGSWEDENH